MNVTHTLFMRRLNRMMQTTLNQISQSKIFDRTDAKWYWKLNTRTDSPYMYERTNLRKKKKKKQT